MMHLDHGTAFGSQDNQDVGEKADRNVAAIHSEVEMF